MDVPRVDGHEHHVDRFDAALLACVGGSHCVENLVNKAKAQGIDDAKVLETFKIARFAEATRVFNNAVPLFAKLAGEQ